MSFIRMSTALGSPRNQSAGLRDSRNLLACQDKSKDLCLEAEQARKQMHADVSELGLSKTLRDLDLEKSSELFLAAIQAMTKGIPTSEWAAADFLRVMNCYKAIVHNYMNSYREDAFSKAAKFCHFAMIFFQDQTNKDVVKPDYYICFAEINWIYADYAAHYYKKANCRLVPGFEDVLLEDLNLAVNALEMAQYANDNFIVDLRKVSILYSEISKVYDFMGFHLAAFRHAINAIKRRANIAEKTSEDYYMLAALCRHAAAISKSDSVLHALFDFMSKFFEGNKFINYLYFQQILKICIDKLDERNHDDIFMIAHFARIIFSSSQSEVLPASNMKTDLREPEILAQLNTLLDPLFIKEASILEEDTAAMSVYITENAVADEDEKPVEEEVVVAEPAADAEQKPAASVSAINIFNEMNDALGSVRGMAAAFESLAERAEETRSYGNNDRVKHGMN